MSEIVKAERIQIQDKINWWVKHKNKVYGVLLLVLGFMGGEVEINDLIPTSPEVIELQQKVSEIEQSQLIVIDLLEKQDARLTIAEDLVQSLLEQNSDSLPDGDMQIPIK